MTSQAELLTLFCFFLILELVTRCEKKFNTVLELVTRDFKEKKISELLTRKNKNYKILE